MDRNRSVSRHVRIRIMDSGRTCWRKYYESLPKTILSDDFYSIRDFFMPAVEGTPDCSIILTEHETETIFIIRSIVAHYNRTIQIMIIDEADVLYLRMDVEKESHVLLLSEEQTDDYIETR